MGPTGPEIDSVTGSATKTLEDQVSEGGAESGAYDPDLAKIIAAWPDLPADARARMLELLEAEEQRR